MRLILFAKIFLVLFVLSLAAFVFMEMPVMTLLKLIAGSLVVAIAVAIIYPELRGIKNGDVVMVLSSDSPLNIIGRFGTALDDGKKNSEIKIKLNDGNELVGIVESYEGMITPPRVRIVYEERLIEGWKR